MQFFRPKPASIPSPAEALPGRPDPIVEPGNHTVLGTPLAGPWPEGTKTAIFGLGCFWGDEKDFWQHPGVVTTAVGYAGGSTPNPTYRETCTGQTGHAEVVLVAYDPSRDLVRAAAQVVLGAPRPDAGHAPGQRHRHPVPLDHHRRRSGAACPGRGVQGDVPGAADRGRLRSDHHRDRRRGRSTRSTTPRTTTSSTSTRIPAAIAPTTRPA